MPTPQELAMALRQADPSMGGQNMAAQPQSWQGGQMQGMGAMGGMTDQQRMMMQAEQAQKTMNTPQQNYTMGNSGTNSMGSAAMGQTMPNNFGAAMGQPIPQRNMMQSERGLSPEEASYLQSLSR